MKTAELSIVYELRTLDARRSWASLRPLFEARGFSPEVWEVYGTKVSAGRVEEYISAMRRRTFHLEAGAVEIHQASVANFGHDLLSIMAPEYLSIDWGPWVDELLHMGNFVFAWLVNEEYKHWQNATDPLQFRARGRSYAHLPMKSNGLPPPLTREIIDTSRNPGRRVLRDGFVEAVGAQMWIGDRFWGLTGAKREWLDVDRRFRVEASEKYLKIVASDSLFDSAEGESVRVQEDLRSTLFPASSGVTP